MAALQSLDDCYSAGWEDGADDEPLTREEIERLSVLHSPYLTAEGEAA